MISIDAFFRSKYAQYESEAGSIRLFTNNRIPSFFPRNLDQRKVNDVVELFSKTKVNISNEMNTRFIRESCVEKFLEKTYAISL